MAWFWAARSAFGFGGLRDISIEEGCVAKLGELIGRLVVSIRVVDVMLKEAGKIRESAYTVVV